MMHDMGYDADTALAATRDCYDIVPRLAGDTIVAA
jgi:hypothetical protein